MKNTRESRIHSKLSLVETAKMDMKAPTAVPSRLVWTLVGLFLDAKVRVLIAGTRSEIQLFNVVRSQMRP